MPAGVKKGHGPTNFFRIPNGRTFEIDPYLSDFVVFMYLEDFYDFLSIPLVKFPENLSDLHEMGGSEPPGFQKIFTQKVKIVTTGPHIV